MPRRKSEYFLLAVICVVVSAEFLSLHHSMFGASFAASRRAQLSRTAERPSPLQPPADLVLTNGKIYTGLAAPVVGQRRGDSRRIHRSDRGREF